MVRSRLLVGLLVAVNVTGCRQLLGLDDLPPPDAGPAIAVTQQAYVKASNTSTGDAFGTAIAISGDGSLLAVGAPFEDSAATGIDGVQADESSMNAGAVYVYTRTGAVWAAQSYVKASNTGTGDQFGFSVALSADGTTLAVSAPQERSIATGIDGLQTDNTAAGAGAVYVFRRSGASWIQEAYVKPSNTASMDLFGTAIALSADGSTLVVGSPGEDSAATGIGGNDADNGASGAGAAYVFTRAGSTWSQAAYVKASNTNMGDEFGQSVAISADGALLAIGAPNEQSGAAGIDADPLDNSKNGAGAVYVFVLGAAWSQQSYVKASNPDQMDQFGAALALSGDASTLAIDAAGESSAATDIDGNQLDNSAQKAGAVYAFARAGASWTQQDYLKATNTEKDDQFGSGLALSLDGARLVTGAVGEDSAATGIGGDSSSNAASAAGAAYVLSRTTGWVQGGYIKASNTNAGDGFGGAVAVSGDGATVALSATGEDSVSINIDGDQTNNALMMAGAVYVFTMQ